jgi:hypothetical protein
MTIHLSTVVTSRNDNHGGTLTYRMQKFIDFYLYQCNKFRIKHELIIVEWNPPDDKKSLYLELKWPKNNKFCDIRIITVPKKIHMKFSNAKYLPLYQMIAKNVGIRRAKGKYILATNIDIIFSNKCFKYINNKLNGDTLYRVNRYDIPGELPDKKFEEVLKWCKHNIIRVNYIYGIIDFINLNYIEKKIFLTSNKIFYLINELKKVGKNFIINNFNKKKQLRVMELLPSSYFLKSTIIKLLRIIYNFPRNIIYFFANLFKFIFTRQATNACGDFTLMSKKNWYELQGYLELPYYSFHIDSVLLHKAKHFKIKEKFIGIDKFIYHIEHSKGSGFTPEGSETLFGRLDKNNIPYLTNEDLEDYRIQKKIIPENPYWGLKKYNLPEKSFK